MGAMSLRNPREDRNIRVESRRMQAGVKPAKGDGAITLFDAYRLWRERHESGQASPVAPVRRMECDEED